MVIQIKRGLDIPLPSYPEGELKELEGGPIMAMDLQPFSHLRMHLAVKVNEEVKIGQIIAFDKKFPERKLASVIHGKILEIERGEKRKIKTIKIEKKDYENFSSENSLQRSQDPDALIDSFFKTGLSLLFKARPFCVEIDKRRPRAIFVQGFESEPYLPPAFVQVSGLNAYVNEGLRILSLICNGHLHFTQHQDSPIAIQSDCEQHFFSGPHPSANLSVAIAAVSPIANEKDLIWTTDLPGVIAVGMMSLEGKIPHTKRIGIGGREDVKGFYEVESGSLVKECIDIHDGLRVISGSPLNGKLVSLEEPLGFFDKAVSIVHEDNQRPWLYFLKPGWSLFSFSKSFLSSLRKKSSFHFSTSQNGEERAFIDAQIYQKVMPLTIPVAALIKALLIEDFPKALKMGFLDVAPEDFVLPSFVCPSKINMVSIVREALIKYASQL
jgi:Na+-transporting NADH:ubiquinone oxidoreductase subunit A